MLRRSAVWGRRVVPRRRAGAKENNPAVRGMCGGVKLQRRVALAVRAELDGEITTRERGAHQCRFALQQTLPDTIAEQLRHEHTAVGHECGRDTRHTP